jgi:hypothetical protein
MLHAQGMIDLLLELNVRVDFVRHEDGSVTSLRYYQVNYFDDLPTAASVVLNEILKRQRPRGLNGAERWLLGGRANS